MRSNRIFNHDLFHFHQNEWKGIRVFALILLILLAVNLYIHFLPSRSFQYTLTSLYSEDTITIDQTKTNSDMTLQLATEKSKLRPFNPNSIGDDQWLELGLSAGHVRSIRKFQNRGGSFQTKEDLGKLYVIPEDLFKKWYDYIQLPAAAELNQRTYAMNDTGTRKVFRGNMVPESFVVDINRADTNALKKLPGIGSYFANQIIRFREALGGFVSIDQLHEVYHLGAERVKLIEGHIRIQSPIIRKLNLNSADEVLLNAHPYLKKHQASSIVHYREKHGPFKDLETLRYVASIDSVTYRKIMPYLSLDDE